jgi:hypothetical protein
VSKLPPTLASWLTTQSSRPPWVYCFRVSHPARRRLILVVMRQVIFTSLFAFFFTSCATSPWRACEAIPHKNWSILSKPPENAPELKASAVASPIFPNSNPRANEYWFRSSDNQILLCRQTPNATDACGSERWFFDLKDSQWLVSDKKGSVCVY